MTLFKAQLDLQNDGCDRETSHSTFKSANNFPPNYKFTVSSELPQYNQFITGHIVFDTFRNTVTVQGELHISK